MRRTGVISAIVVTVLILVACSPSDVGLTVTPSSAQAQDELAPLATSTPTLSIEDPNVLALLESSGYDLGALLTGSPGAGAAQLASDRRYGDMVDALRRDLKAAAKADPDSGVGMRFGHRAFDPDWLTDARMYYELIAVVNRLDRQPFAPARCGESRLIYRLAYETEVEGIAVRSRLPMTINVVYWNAPPNEGCGEVARRWLRPASVGEDATSLAEWLTGAGGALEGLTGEALKAVEVNMQSVRWPATVHPSMAGHAEYIMRVFHPSGDGGARLTAAPLENTPDVARLKRDRSAKGELLAWLREPATLTAIDAGVVLTPERFLAKQATSVAPRGLARLSNRPYDQLYDASDFSDLDLTSYQHIRSPRALLRRLDSLSCTGCHHSRSIAGFHHLGAEDRDDRQVDALRVGASPHFEAERARRLRDLRAVLGGGAIEGIRPFPERQEGGGHNARCGLGDPGFASWTCDPGLRCMATEDPDVGVCVPEETEAGDPCEVGQINRKAHPHKDRIKQIESHACGGGGICEANRVGFPAGMCVRTCKNPGPNGVCGRIPLLVGFNRCIARKLPFEQCLLAETRPAGMRACDARRPCRDDYICARTDQPVGACMPPYFLFQLRVDGHPL